MKWRNLFMTMPLTMEWNIITEGKEMRYGEKENVFEIQFSGYRLFPLDELVNIMRHEESEQIGTAKIVELNWKNDVTTIKYILVSLYSVN